MRIRRNFFYLAFLYLFFSCQSVQPAVGNTAGFVLVEDFDDYCDSHLYSDDLQKVSLPEIIGLPVEIVPASIQQNDFREKECNTESPSALAVNHLSKYLLYSQLILPGLTTTEIVYPFHAFW